MPDRNSRPDHDWLLRAKMEAKKKAGIRNYKEGRQCCEDLHNLRYAPGQNHRVDTVVLRCKQCKSMHYVLMADPAKVGAKLA